jgi:hypothetical protein
VHVLHCSQAAGRTESPPSWTLHGRLTNC